MNNLSITPGINNVGAYINKIELKNLHQSQVNEIKDILGQFGVSRLSACKKRSQSPTDLLAPCCN